MPGKASQVNKDEGGLTLIVRYQKNRQELTLKINEAMFLGVRASADDYCIKNDIPLLSNLKVAKLTKAVCVTQGTPSTQLYWRMPEIAKEWGVSLKLLKRCWNDYDASRSGVAQLGLFDKQVQSDVPVLDSTGIV